MRLILNTNTKPLTISFTVSTKSKQNITIRVRDANKPFTYYTDRTGFVDGTRKFSVKMPQSPAVSLIQIFNTRNGDMPVGKDTSFTINDAAGKPTISHDKLQTALNCYDSKNPVITNFIRFAQQFSERASILSTNQSVYLSDNGRFRIDYMDVIRDDRTGRPLATPARISHNKGVIQIAKKYFITYTVPMRMAILLHEFSHFYLNKNISNEVEADLNAVLIACCMGYPLIEIQKAFIEVFKGTPSNQNKMRLKKILAFISNFDEFTFKYN